VPNEAAAAGVAGIAHVIQLSIAPVFLLSGVSAMLGVLSHRISRIIDRARILEARLESASVDHAVPLRTELSLLGRRARLVSHAISLCTICALLICAVVIGLFLGAFFGTDVSYGIGVLFIAALSALAGGLVTFLREIYLALRNLRIGPVT
jgi:phosphoglycerol transferase MdoB-like AlkP superfamily enzyme